MSVVCASEFTQTLVYFITETERFYLIPLIHSRQNLVKDQSEEVTVKVYKQNIDTLADQVYFPNATVTGNFTRPSGIVDQVNFTNLDTGNYTYNYTFNRIGTYRLDVKAESDIARIGYSLSKAYIYVGKFPIYLELLPGTEYMSNETGEVDVYVTDDNANPITGGTAKIWIWYPNKTLWVNGSSMQEHLFGIYYYNFTTPETTGEYLAYVNFTSGSNHKQAMDKFHVAPWTDSMTGPWVDTIDDIYDFLNDSFYGNIAVDPSVVTGEVTIGSTYTTDISLVNLGTLPITISNVTAPAKVTPEFTNGTIEASGDETLTLTYNTDTLGNITGNVTIYSDARGASTINVSIDLDIVAGGAEVSEGGTMFLGRGVTTDTSFFHYVDTTKKEEVCKYVRNFLESHRRFTEETEQAIYMYTAADIIELRDRIARDMGINVKYSELKSYVDYPDRECPEDVQEPVSRKSWAERFYESNRSSVIAMGMIFVLIIVVALWYYDDKRKSMLKKLEFWKRNNKGAGNNRQGPYG